MRRLGHLREFAQLRTCINQIASEEALCACRLPSPTGSFSRPSNTLVREWHRLACCASATS